MPRPNFVGQVRLNSTKTSLDVEWDAPYRGVEPNEYIVVLRDVDGNVIKDTRRVVDADNDQQVSYTDLTEGGTYRVAIRGKAGRQRGRWIVTTVTLGDNPPALPDSHYMYMVAAGEETPDDAIGSPTRHVRLENGVWTPFDPGREYKANQMWWWYNQLDASEENIVKTKEALDTWKEENPNAEFDHPIISTDYEFAVQETEAIRKKIAEEEAKVDAEIALRYPPEEYTVNEARWVQRPKLRHKSV